VTGVININESNCWMCGKTDNITSHHCLPKHLKPKKNVIVPICKKCHHKINTVDYGSIISYCYKVVHTMNSSTNNLKDIIGKLKEINDTTKEVNKSV